MGWSPVGKGSAGCMWGRGERLFSALRNPAASSAMTAGARAGISRRWSCLEAVFWSVRGMTQMNSNPGKSMLSIKPSPWPCESLYRDKPIIQITKLRPFMWKNMSYSKCDHFGQSPFSGVLTISSTCTERQQNSLWALWTSQITTVKSDNQSRLCCGYRPRA